MPRSLNPAARRSVPYFGVANAMSNAPVLDSTSTYSRYYAQDARYPFLTPDMMTIQTRDNSLSYTKANGATIFARLARESPSLSAVMYRVNG